MVEQQLQSVKLCTVLPIQLDANLNPPKKIFQSEVSRVKAFQLPQNNKHSFWLN